MNFDKKIYVAGHLGMTGTAIVKKLRQKGFSNIDVRARTELDLTNFDVTTKYLKRHKPDFIIHTAGYVGGIQTNISQPIDF